MVGYKINNQRSRRDDWRACFGIRVIRCIECIREKFTSKIRGNTAKTRKVIGARVRRLLCVKCRAMYIWRDGDRRGGGGSGNCEL